jgi:(S)-ureidoglycine-glyoxylate aminotransferase
MTPGPIAIDERVIVAAQKPAVTPDNRAYLEVVEDVFQMLRSTFRTEAWVTVLPGSGRIGLEASIVSVIEPGDACVCIVNGAFGELAVEIARRARAQVTVIEGRWGGPIDLEAVKRAVQQARPKLVTLVHSETSTGALYDPCEIEAISHKYGALFMMDVISSYPNMRFEMDAMGCDLAVGASNKGIGALHGLNMVAVSPRALQVMKARQTPCFSLSHDLKRWDEMYFGKTAGRRSATPAPTHLMYSLQEACRLLVEEGLEQRWARGHRYAEATRRAVQAAGLEIFPDRELCGNCVTAIRVPEGLDGPEILRRMEAQGVLVAGTVMRPGPISGKLIRISHQGVQANAEMLIPTLAAFERVLRGLGMAIERGTMVTAFEACLNS